MPSPPVEMHQVRLPVPVPSHGVGEFSVGLGLSLHQAVVNVRGEVDALTGPTLHAVLDAAVEQVECEVVLELSELTFMDAAGLSAIASTVATLGATGRKLSIRSAPATTLRILDITGLSDLVRVNEPDPEAAPLGAEQFTNDRSPSCRESTRQPSLRLRASPVGAGHWRTRRCCAPPRHFACQRHRRRCRRGERDPGRAGRLATVAASNETVSRMDCHQYETGEGPCLAAAAEGHWFHIESLRDETRWPAFVPLALDEGIASILSTPLLVADRSGGHAQHLLQHGSGLRCRTTEARSPLRNRGVGDPRRRRNRHRRRPANKTAHRRCAE